MKTHGCCTLWLLLTSPCAAQIDRDLRGSGLTIIALTGDPLPTGAGAFAFFEDARINEHGQVSFAAGLSGTPSGLDDNSAIYLYDPTSGVQQLMREGMPVPGGGVLSTFGSPTLDGAGQVVASALLENTPGGSADNSGLYGASPGSGVYALAREGDPAPDGNGDLQFLEGAGVSEAGPAVFFADIDNTSGGFLDDEALMVWTPPGALAQIVRASEASPTGAGTYSSLGVPRVTVTGEAAFFADLTGVPEDKLVLRWTQGGGVSVVLVEGTPSPDANGVYATFSDPAIGSDGAILVDATLRDTQAGADDNRALVLASDTVEHVVREGDPAPSGDGVFASFSRTDVASESIAAFSAILRMTPAGLADDRAVYSWDSGDLYELFREGDSVPGHPSTFTGFGGPVVSSNAQAAVLATIDQSGVPGSAILIGRGASERELLIATGDLLSGSTVTDLRFASDEVLGSGFVGMDQLAFTFELADGRFGIATIRTPPACPADLDNDRMLTFTDVSQFLVLFAAGDLGANFQPDLSLDFLDVVAFLNAFVTPCAGGV